MAGIRRAVVIGVNKYADDCIDDLSGAVPDATEIRDVLRHHGGFVIDHSHFLTDGNATAEKIRGAISDLFWKTEECDIALFYFAGHGKRDHLEYGYILPHDATFNAPLVRGIRIQELKDIFLRARSKKTGMLVLDCCYSGIATERGDDSEHIRQFNEETSLDGRGRGRFILASAGADKAAREEEREHSFSGEKHVHGLFSFHLIEGLRHGPRDDFKRISLGALVRHLDNAFKDDPKHTPQLNIAAGTNVSEIYLSTMADEFQIVLSDRINKINQTINGKTPNNLFAALELLKDLEMQNIECDDIPKCYAAISAIIDQSSAQAYKWWLQNRYTIRNKITDNSSWYELLNEHLQNLQMVRIRQLEQMQRGFLADVLEIITTDMLLLDAAERGRDATRSALRVAAQISILDRDHSVSASDLTSPSARALLPAAAS